MFKKELTDWEYTQVDEEDKKKMKAKNVLIWNLLGEQLCLKYQQKGVKIEYLEATEEYQEQFQADETVHYIMCLDESGSMSGSPWRELMSAVSSFFSQLEASEILNPGL